MATQNDQIYGPVLLVCIFNKYGNIITHDYFYQLFSQYGDVQKILIFQKAKVWKTFIQFSQTYSAGIALKNLNNRPVFDDGSKMNIFSSKLQSIKLQNNNLGGVNYEELKHGHQSFQDTQMTRSRKRTLDSTPVSQSTGSCVSYLTDSPLESQELKSFTQNSSTFSYGDQSYGEFTTNSIGIFDVDEQFREIAMQSEEFRQLKKDQQEEYIRKKSKTLISNPHTEQFLLENSPCKVLFARSIPLLYNSQIMYNIFKNFGIVERIIYFKDKRSALVEFNQIQEAINAKDQLNYAKTQIKIFYSHYETLSMRKQAEGEEFHEYSQPSGTSQSNKITINPPSQTLYLTFVNPYLQTEIEKMCRDIGCPIINTQWKQNGNKKDKWMCLVQFQNVQQALLVMGFLQGADLSNGKKLRISFTKSKIRSNRAKVHFNQSKNSICQTSRKRYREKASHT